MQGGEPRFCHFSWGGGGCSYFAKFVERGTVKFCRWKWKSLHPCNVFCMVPYTTNISSLVQDISTFLNNRVMWPFDLDAGQQTQLLSRVASGHASCLQSWVASKISGLCVLNLTLLIVGYPCLTITTTWPQAIIPTNTIYY